MRVVGIRRTDHSRKRGSSRVGLLMAAVVVELEKDGDHNDGARSIRTIVSYELERENEEDGDQLVEQEEQQAE